MPICLEGMVPNQKLPRRSPWAPVPRNNDSVAACLRLWMPSFQWWVLILDQNGSAGTACFLTVDHTCWQGCAKPWEEGEKEKRSVGASLVSQGLNELTETNSNEVGKNLCLWMFFWGRRFGGSDWLGFIAWAEHYLFPAGRDVPVWHRKCSRTLVFDDVGNQRNVFPSSQFSPTSWHQ